MATYSITGIVVGLKRQQPLVGLRVEAWDKDMLIDDLLGAATTNARGIFVLQFDRRYYQELLFDRKPDVYFRVYSGDRLVLDTSDSVIRNIATQSDPVLLAIPDDAIVTDPTASTTFAVSGFLSTPTRQPIPNVTVVAYDKGIDGLVALGSGITDENGRYTIRYDQNKLVGKTHADLVIKAFTNSQLTEELAKSEVKYAAGSAEAVSFTIADREELRGAEYDRLLAALQPYLAGKSLQDLREEGETEHITYLARKSGWDPRMVAMAARAAAIGGETGISPAHVYAIFRAGIPNNDRAFYSLGSEALTKVLHQAAENGVITSEKRIDETLRLYRTAATSHALSSPVGTATSSLGEILNLSLNSDQQAIFMAAQEATAHEPATLWSALAERGMDVETIQQLKNDATLGFLTLQNAPLMATVKQQLEVSRPEELARHQLYEAQAWEPLVANAVPPGYSAAEYAAGLAMQVSLNYPTQVTADLMRRGSLGVLGDTRLSPAPDFLEQGAGRYELGMHPVKTWEGFAELDNSTQAVLKRVERQFQLSPSNGAMVAMSKNGLNSALDVVAYTEQEFVAKFGDEFPSPAEAAMVYKKSHGVYGTTLNMTMQYFTGVTGPTIYGVHGNGPVVVAPPTMEELFGSMDYCACSHCRSVLSPAAYLVDLLQFMDMSKVPHQLANPLTQLLSRRPDIQHLLLSCENTNTAMPYIDLVNEVLEYYVANGNLTGFEGYNTAEGTQTADLLADPVHVQLTAYTHPGTAVYPMTLPFDRPLEHLRLIVQSFDTDLPDALNILDTPANSRREMLGLNQTEYNILVGTSGNTVPQYYGLAQASTIAQVNTAIANAKVFCRNTDLKYAELVDLLKTRFVNPGVVWVPLLQALGLSMQNIKNFYQGTLTGPALVALIDPSVDQSPYTPDVPQWLNARRDQILKLIVLTDQHPENLGCDFGNMELRFADPDANDSLLDMHGYDRLHRFLRLWRKLGWSMELTDAVVNALLPVAPSQLDSANINGHFEDLLARIANLKRLMRIQKISLKKLPLWLSLWDSNLASATRLEILAKALKAGLTDLEELIAITGHDPLAADMENDAPSLLSLVAAWKLLKAAGPKVVDIAYLLHNQDLTGKLALTDATLKAQVKLLRDGLSAVEASLASAPANPDLDYARTRMALVYDNTVVADFMGLVGNNTTYTAPFFLQNLDSLPTVVADADVRLGYNAFLGQLTYSGQMTAGAQAAINAAAAGQFVNQAAFAAAVQQLRDAGTNDFNTLNTSYPVLGALYNTLLPLATDSERAQAILAAILPAVKDKLKDNALRQTLAAILKTEALTVDTLANDKDVLAADSNANLPALVDLRNLERVVDLSQNGSHDFYIEVPATDNYILYVKAGNGTDVRLSDGSGAVLIPAQTIAVVAPATEAEVQTGVAIAWTAGTLVRLQLDISNLNGHLELSWRTNGMAKAAVPAAKLYGSIVVGHAQSTLVRLQKSVLLQGLLKLSPAELGHFAAVDSETQGILNGLRAQGLVTGANLNAQWGRMQLLLQFALLKKATEQEADTWLQVLRNPGATTPTGQSILLALNGWTQPNLNGVLTHYGLAQAALSTLSNLYKVRDAMTLVGKTYYASTDITDWIVANPDAAKIDAIKATMRSVLDETAWLETMESISDGLRNRSRDALVAYILHHMPPSPEIQNPDQLYEYFLIDVQMDACMKTSRVRMALSSVQLFIQRCLMNLETNVSPDSIRSKQWQWMKRYRVWEANRKIFLWPENWLEPELRDNKSSFFKELEGELLKSDITDELAEEAFLHYLKKLDDVANLEIIGTYLQEQEANNDKDDILHVIGRTNGSSRQYYYRRYEYGYWTPWEKVGLQIEGDIVLPVIWKSKLFLFWLQVNAKPAAPIAGTAYTVAEADWSANTLKDVEISFHWGEYYKGKWVSPKSSELKRPVLWHGIQEFDPDKLQLTARTYRPTAPNPGVKLSEKLVFNLWWLPYGGSSGRARVTFTSKNAPPMIEVGQTDATLQQEVDEFMDALFLEPHNSSFTDINGFYDNGYAWPSKQFKVDVKQPPNSASSVAHYTLTTKLGSLFPGYVVRPLLHPIKNQWNAPFFYRDEHSTFFVQPKEKVVLVKEEPGVYFPELPPINVELPPIFEKPWPIPEDPFGPLVNPMGPVINPGEGMFGEQADIRFILPSESPFAFGDLMLDAGGRVDVMQASVGNIGNNIAMDIR